MTFALVAGAAVVYLAGVLVLWRRSFNASQQKIFAAAAARHKARNSKLP